jgi:hypothetical protein
VGLLDALVDGAALQFVTELLIVKLQYMFRR